MVLSFDLWVKESGNFEGREKLVYQCMPLFLSYFFLSYIFTFTCHLVFLFSFVRFLFLFLLCVFPLLSVYTSCLLLFMAISLPFILLEFIGFLPFVPKAVPTIFWFLVSISPGLPTNLLVAQPLPLLRACLSHHYPFPDKIHCFVPPPPPHLYLASLPQTDKG